MSHTHYVIFFAVSWGTRAGKPFIEGAGAEIREPVKKVLAPEH